MKKLNIEAKDLKIGDKIPFNGKDKLITKLSFENNNECVKIQFNGEYYKCPVLETFEVMRNINVSSEVL